MFCTLMKRGFLTNQSARRVLITDIIKPNNIQSVLVDWLLNIPLKLFLHNSRFPKSQEGLKIKYPLTLKQIFIYVVSPSAANATPVATSSEEELSTKSTKNA